LYGVADRIQFIIGDFFALAPTLKADVVFLSPPWGGPELMNFEEYKLSNVMPENGGIQNILSLARKITSNIALHLPKNTNIFDVKKKLYYDNNHKSSDFNAFNINNTL
jgi:trimethylguanosine synthase